MTSADLLRAAVSSATELDVVGPRWSKVIPSAVGSATSRPSSPGQDRPRDPDRPRAAASRSRRRVVVARPEGGLAARCLERGRGRTLAAMKLFAARTWKETLYLLLDLPVGAAGFTLAVTGLAGARACSSRSSACRC